MLNTFYAAFILGLLGSFHCIGMCGPLVLAMPFQSFDGNKKILPMLFYHFGKSISYGMLGIFAGALGKTFIFFKWQQSLSIIAGLFILGITFFPYLKNKIKLPSTFNNFYNNIFQKQLQEKHWTNFLTIGFLNGLLPCGLVYTALAAAIISTTPISGFLFMFIFGLGTIPSLSFLILVKNNLSVNYKKYLFKTTYYISILVGLLLILRGLNLNIPYISPAVNAQKTEMNCCHKK